nr:integrase [Lactobacillus delbrueckii]
MGHKPYGYRIENGKAVIDEEVAAKIKKLYEAYLAGASFQSAANEAGIEVKHCGAKRMMANRHYLGDDFYPAIIDKDTFDKAEAEKQRRAEALGRLNRKINLLRQHLHIFILKSLKRTVTILRFRPSTFTA